MCEATSIITQNGERVYIKCAVTGDYLCYYHRKMRDGLICPSEQCEGGGRIVCVECEGSVLWDSPL